MAQQDVVVSCEHLLARADSMLEASMKLIDQARPEDAREQISGAHSALTEAIGILEALLL